MAQLISSEPQQATMSDHLRNALRQVAASVAIVAAHGRTHPVGMTATALSVVSLSPPLLLVCVNRSCQLHSTILEQRTFRISYLSQQQREIASVFGGGTVQIERFSTGTWDLSAESGPALRGAVASFGCSLSSHFDQGTHTIFIGAVQNVQFTAEPPLVYRDGGYRQVM